MRKLNIRQQIVSITIIIAVLSAIIILAIIIPSTKQIISLEKDITDTQKFLEKQYESTQRMRRSVHSLDETIEQTEKFKYILIQKGQELSIIEELEKIASKNNINQNIKVNMADPKQKKPTEAEKDLPKELKNRPYYIFSFSNDGSFENLIKYINELDKMPYYFNINSIYIDKKRDSNLLTLRFDAKIFTNDN